MFILPSKDVFFLHWSFFFSNLTTLVRVTSQKIIVFLAK